MFLLTPSRGVWEHFSHVAITGRRLFVYSMLQLSQHELGGVNDISQTSKLHQLDKSLVVNSMESLAENQCL